MKLHELLKNLRTCKGLSLTDVSNRLDNLISPQTLSKYENNDLGCSLDNLMLILNALDAKAVIDNGEVQIFSKNISEVYTLDDICTLYGIDEQEFKQALSKHLPDIEIKHIEVAATTNTDKTNYFKGLHDYLKKQYKRIPCILDNDLGDWENEEEPCLCGVNQYITLEDEPIETLNILNYSLPKYSYLLENGCQITLVFGGNPFKEVIFIYYEQLIYHLDSNMNFKPLVSPSGDILGTIYEERDILSEWMNTLDFLYLNEMGALEDNMDEEDGDVILPIDAVIKMLEQNPDLDLTALDIPPSVINRAKELMEQNSSSGELLRYRLNGYTYEYRKDALFNQVMFNISDYLQNKIKNRMDN